MGYTHYFSHKQTKIKTWGKIQKDCQKLLAKMPAHSGSSGGHYDNEPLLLNGCFAHEEPQFTKNFIHFNGSDESYIWAKDSDHCSELSHETFRIDRVPDAKETFHFCKTARKPYDLMVQACLLVYKHHSPETMELGSDGDPDDWKEAEKFVKDVLGYSVKFKEVNKY